MHVMMRDGSIIIHVFRTNIIGICVCRCISKYVYAITDVSRYTLETYLYMNRDVLMYRYAYTQILL